MRALRELVAGTAASLADTHRPGENHRQGGTIPRCWWRPSAARPRELTSPLERGGEDGRIRVRGWRGRGCSIFQPSCRTVHGILPHPALNPAQSHRSFAPTPAGRDPSATCRPPIAPRVPEAFAADVDPETAGLMAATQRPWSGAGTPRPRARRGGGRSRRGTCCAPRTGPFRRRAAIHGRAWERPDRGGGGLPRVHGVAAGGRDAAASECYAARQGSR
jgi:hypothetical protein